MTGKDEGDLNDGLETWSDWFRDVVGPVSLGVTSSFFAPKIYEHRLLGGWTLHSLPIDGHAGSPRSVCD